MFLSTKKYLLKITRIADEIDKLTASTQPSTSFKMRVSGGCIYFSNGHTQRDESFNFEGISHSLVYIQCHSDVELLIKLPGMTHCKLQATVS